MTLRITMLYDNDSLVKGTTASWGFSCLIERAGVKLLFDTGWDGDELCDNATNLGIDLSEIDAIFLSHDHWDHIGGLAKITRIAKTKRPDVFAPISLSRRLKDVVSQRATLVEVAREQPLMPGFYSTGEMGKETKEQSLLIEAQGGIVIVTGCSHQGLEDVIELAQKRGRIKALIGGFHSFDNLDKLEVIENIWPCHCTERKQEILKGFPQRANRCGVGLEIEL